MGTKSWPELQVDDLYTHLGQVIVLMLSRWVDTVNPEQRDRNGVKLNPAVRSLVADDRAVADFCSTLPAIEEALSSLRKRFEDMHGVHHACAQRLLQEVDEIQEAGQQVHSSRKGTPATAL